MAKTTTVPQTVEGQLVHTEFMAQDAPGLKKFLEKHFGWKFQTMSTPEGDYHLFSTPGGTAGGLGQPSAGQTVGTVAYIGVKDIRATTKAIQKGGAEILVPPTEVPGYGWMMHFRYKGSPVLACWQGTSGGT